MCAKSLQSCPALCNSMDCSPLGSSVYGILQARTLEWVVISSFSGIFLIQGSNQLLLCCLHWEVGSLPLVLSGKLYIYIYIYISAKLLQSCPTLCDPIDSSPPGFPVPGNLQARTLEWFAISFSNASK